MGTLAHAPQADNILTKPEYESLSAHTIDSGVSGDLLYYNGTQIVTLAIGAAGTVLTSNGTTMSWGSIGAGAFPLLGPNDTSGAPNYSWSSMPTTGVYRVGANTFAFTHGGSPFTYFSGGEIRSRNTQSLSWSNGDPAVAAGDLFLYRDAANVLAQRNSTVPQEYRLYGTYTDGSNYERGFLRLTSGDMRIGFEAAGTGVAGGLEFMSSGNVRWTIGAAGHLLAGSDNALDIGASGATRPRDIYVAGTVVVSGSYIQLTNATGRLRPGATNFSITNSAFTNDNLLITDAGIITIRDQLRGANGSAAAPTYSFSSEPDCGFYVSNTNYITASTGGAGRFLFNNAEVRLGASIQFGWAGAADPNDAGQDLSLWRDAANTLAQRNGTTAQVSRIYYTYTDASNYERYSVSFDGSSRLIIGHEAAGTGTLRAVFLNGASLDFQTNGSGRWSVNTSGHFVAGADNTYDIGASGATRPRFGYFGTAVVSPIFSSTGTVASAGIIRLTNTGSIMWRNAGNTADIGFNLNIVDRLQLSSGSGWMIGGGASRSVTMATNHIDIYNGTAPSGTLANGATFYAQAGEMWVMNAAGTPTQLSPHDPDGYWWFNSRTREGKKLQIDVEKILRYVNDRYGLDMVRELEEAGV